MYTHLHHHPLTCHLQDSKAGHIKFVIMKEKKSHTHHQPKGTSLPDLIRFVLDTHMYNPTQPAPSHMLSHSKSRVTTLEMASHSPSADVQAKKTRQKSLDRRYCLLSCSRVYKYQKF